MKSIRKIIVAAFFQLAVIFSFAQITPLPNTIPGEQIIDAEVFNGALYLASDSSLYKYDGSLFTLVKNYYRNIIGLEMVQGALYVFYKDFIYLGCEIYNGQTTDIKSVGYNHTCNDVKYFNGAFYFAANTSYRTNSYPYEGVGYKWDGVSENALFGITSINTHWDVNPIDVSIFNNKVVFSGGFVTTTSNYKSNVINEDDIFLGSKGLRSEATLKTIAHGGFLYAYGKALKDTTILFNHCAKWNGTKWTGVNSNLLDSADMILAMSKSNNFLYAFPSYGDEIKTKVTVAYLNNNQWQLLNDTLSISKTYNGYSSRYHFGVIEYAGEQYVFGTEMKLNNRLIFPKIGKLPSSIGLYENNRINEISVYPNPTDGIIKLITLSNSKLTIHDLNGNKVASGLNEVDLSRLKSGIYFVEIVLEDGNVMYQKIIRK